MLMSGAAAVSKRLMMFSGFRSLQGVTLGGGGMAGRNYRGEGVRVSVCECMWA